MIWTATDDATLTSLYPTHTGPEIAALLGRTLPSIENRRTKLGLSKATNSGCFSAEKVPWNKGTSFNAGGRSIETQFKKGQLTGRAKEIAKPVGSERISKDGYLQRKINNDLPFHKRWRGVHIVNWEAINGPLPKGHALIFRDGNKQHTAVENLELIKRSDLMRRNSLHNYGEEIASAYQLKGAISRQINRINRHE